MERSGSHERHPTPDENSLPPDITQVIDEFYYRFTWIMTVPPPKTWNEVAKWAKDVTDLTVKTKTGLSVKAKNELMQQLAALIKELDGD